MIQHQCYEMMTNHMGSYTDLSTS